VNLQNSVQHTTANVTAVTVPVTLEQKQQYWFVHAVLMAIKQMDEKRR